MMELQRRTVMKIKKIEWVTVDDKSDPSRPVGKLVKRANLPFGCVAVIKQHYDRYRWMIKVVRLSVAFFPPIGAGDADSIEEAEGACQTTWKKMVMEAFEPEEGKKSKCKFCNDPHEPIHDLKGYPQYNDFTAKVDENGPSIDVHYVVNGRDRYEYMDIDYCPICGRKLEGEQ